MLDVLALVGALLFGIPIVLLVSNRIGGDDRAWLGRMLVFAFLLRIAFATMFALWPASRVFHEDATGYETTGMAIASSWHGIGQRIYYVEDLHQNYGYWYLTAGLYYVFGLIQVIPTYFNALLGTLSVLLVHRLARMFFHTVVARRAALLTAFVPSMVLWHSIALKDTPITFLILVTLSSAVSLKKRFTLTALLGIVLPVMAVQPIRFYTVYILALAVVGSFFLDRGSRLASGVSKQILIVLGFGGVLVAVGFAGRAQEGLDFASLEYVSNFRHGMAVSANSGFSADIDISTPGGAISFLPIGMSMLLFSPFPWQFTSLRAALAAPEMVLWWFLFPSLLRGLSFAIRKKFSECSAVLLFTAVLTVTYSFMHGNVGSGFRQRAQIFVFLFIFTSLGQYQSLCRRRGIDEKLLLKGENDPSDPEPAPVAVPEPGGSPA